VKKLLAVLLLLSCASSAGAAEFNAETREFASRNNAFRLKVGYSGTNGGGRAKLELRDSEGKRLSVFEAGSAPFSVTVSDNGERLFLFCGSWGQTVQLSSLNVYKGSGAFLASHRLNMLGAAGEAFSGNGSVYALGADHGSSWTILVLNTESGKTRWSRKFRERLVGLKLSGSGERLLAVFTPAEGRHRAAIFDKSGKEIWTRAVNTKNDLSPAVFSQDGNKFELWEKGAVYREEDENWHATLLKKHFYRFTPKGVRETGVKELNEEFK